MPALERIGTDTVQPAEDGTNAMLSTDRITLVAARVSGNLEPALVARDGAQSPPDQLSPSTIR